MICSIQFESLANINRHQFNVKYSLFVELLGGQISRTSPSEAETQSNRYLRF